MEFFANPALQNKIQYNCYITETSLAEALDEPIKMIIINLKIITNFF